MSHLSRFILCAAITASSANAALLTLGARSGSITVTAMGEASGASLQNQSQTINVVPSGFASATVYANPFSSGIGSPPDFGGPPTGRPQFGVAIASINLGSVVNDSLTLSAAAEFQYIAGSNSGNVTPRSSYTFDQQVVITTPVNYTLQLNVTRPESDVVSTNPDSGSFSSTLPTPGISFAGAGVSYSLTAPYPFIVGTNTTPQSVSQTFTGVLQPGTYSFDSGWGGGSYYPSGGMSDDRVASVSATLSVAALPEPTSIVVCLGVLLSLGHFRSPTIRRRTLSTMTRIIPLMKSPTIHPIA